MGLEEFFDPFAVLASEFSGAESILTKLKASMLLALTVGSLPQPSEMTAEELAMASDRSTGRLAERAAPGPPGSGVSIELVDRCGSADIFTDIADAAAASAELGNCLMPRLHSVSETDNGSKLQAQVGDVIHLRLTENPTTGYRWMVLTGAQSILSLRKDDFQPLVSGSIGSAGERSFRFEVISSGVAQLKLVLRREWEPDSAAQKQYHLTVVVSD